MNAQFPSNTQDNKFNQLIEKFRAYNFDLPQELLLLLDVAQIDFDHIFYKLELCTALTENIQIVYQISHMDLISLQLGVLFSSLLFEGVDVQHIFELDLFQLDEKVLTLIEAMMSCRLQEHMGDGFLDTTIKEEIEYPTFVLTAIFRLILSLDTSLTHSTRIVDIDSHSQGIHIRIDGPYAYSDLIPAQAESRLLAQVLRIPIFVLSDQPPRNAQLKKLPVDLRSIGVTAFDDMSEAGRKILRFHFTRMVYHEPGTRKGEAIEELHDMRVATRRMRSAIGTFRPYYEKKAIKPFIKDLRAIGLVLGAVRDLDVFMKNLEIDIESKAEAKGLGLSTLIAFLREKRELVRSDMIRHLDSDQYQKFLLDFSKFLNTPFAGAKVYDPSKSDAIVVQNATASLIKNHWANIRSFTDEIASASVERLHKLRIEIKKLRYSVEFLRDVLGYESEGIIDGLRQIQDHLGKLNDSVVASVVIGEFLEKLHQEQKHLDIVDSGRDGSVETYLLEKHAERNNLIAAFSGVWNQFVQSEFEQKLFRMALNI